MHTYLVAYDICNPKRLRKVAKTYEDFGIRRQYSVFLCRLSPLNLVRLKTRLFDIIDLKVDQVIFLPLCESCAGQMESLGRPVEAHDACDVVIVRRRAPSWCQFPPRAVIWCFTGTPIFGRKPFDN